MPIFYQPVEDTEKKMVLPTFNIAWLFPSADLLNPSNRLRRYQIGKYLGDLPGIQSENFFEYTKSTPIEMFAKLESFNVVVFFNVSMYDQDLCHYLYEAKKIIIFDHCENIFGLGSEDGIMGWSSAITCCSSALARLTETYLANKGYSKPIFVIRDPIDDNVHFSRPPLVRDIALILGMGGNVNYVLPKLEALCEKADYQIMVISEPGLSLSPRHIYKIWSPYTWVEDAHRCSVALCYHDWSQFPAKGNVKVTAPMSVGLPVIAVPVDSYREAITDAYDGYVCGSDRDWITSLNALKDSGVRTMMGLRARQKVLTNYSTSKIALDYLAMISYLRK